MVVKAKFSLLGHFVNFAHFAKCFNNKKLPEFLDLNLIINQFSSYTFNLTK
jgi:hypothetical protein